MTVLTRRLFLAAGGSALAYAAPLVSARPRKTRSAGLGDAPLGTTRLGG